MVRKSLTVAQLGRNPFSEHPIDNSNRDDKSLQDSPSKTRAFWIALNTNLILSLLQVVGSILYWILQLLVDFGSVGRYIETVMFRCPTLLLISMLVVLAACLQTKGNMERVVLFVVWALVGIPAWLFSILLFGMRDLVAM